MALTDSEAFFQPKKALALATAGTAEVIKSDNYIDRSSGIANGEITGDLGNGRPVIILLQVGNFTDADASNTIGATDAFKVNLVAGDKIHNSDVVVGSLQINTSTGAVTERVKLENRDLSQRVEAFSIVPGDATTSAWPQLQFKVPPRALFGRYLQLEFSLPGGMGVSSIEAWVGRKTGDAQFYYKDRSSII